MINPHIFTAGKNERQVASIVSMSLRATPKNLCIIQQGAMFIFYFFQTTEKVSMLLS